MPRPPPPAAAFTSSGKPIFIASALKRSTLSRPSPWKPGTIGTPAFCMAARADVLSPMMRIAAPLGPTKISPAAATWSAKSAFCDRKP
jgi:hypothetical protein